MKTCNFDLVNQLTQLTIEKSRGTLIFENSPNCNIYHFRLNFFELRSECTEAKTVPQ